MSVCTSQHFCTMSLVICDPLQENCPFAKNYQNMVGAHKVAIAKKLIPDQKHFWQEMESLFLSVHVEQIESLKVVAKR